MHIHRRHMISALALISSGCATTYGTSFVAEGQRQRIDCIAVDVSFAQFTDLGARAIATNVLRAVGTERSARIFAENGLKYCGIKGSAEAIDASHVLRIRSNEGYRQSGTVEFNFFKLQLELVDAKTANPVWTGFSQVGLGPVRGSLRSPPADPLLMDVAILINAPLRLMHSAGVVQLRDPGGWYPK